MEQLIRKYYRRRTVALLALIAMGIYFYIVIPRNWRIRPEVQGRWVSVSMQGDTTWLEIAKNGITSGKLGAATFESCVVLDARGTTERLANSSPDYTLVGYLKGPLFPGDSAGEREIKMPLRVSHGQLEGVLFQIHNKQPDTLGIVRLQKP